jgi:tellurite resistance-related uncharacterized protein
MSAPYATSPIFDEQNLPDSLRHDHRTKAGTWGLLRVLEGEVRLIFIEPHVELRVTPASPALIPPQATHYVVPVGAMRMQVEFFRERPHLSEDPANG